MKKIIKQGGLVCFGAVALLATSCSDLLDSQPRDLISTEIFYETPLQIEQGVIGAYSQLRPLSNDEYLYMSEVRSDNVWSQPLTDGLRDFSEIGTFRAGNDIIAIDNTWNDWYKVILATNAILDNIGGIDFTKESSDEVKTQFTAEARFLRGWAYFELVRLYGSVPLIDKKLTTYEVENVKQSPAKEIYEKIILPDMIFARDNLPLQKDMKTTNKKLIPTTGRANKIAATAMLGRIYMTRAGFPVEDASAMALAKTELKAVIDYSDANSSKFWAPNITEWRKQWMPMSDYYNKYSIFAIQYRSGGTGNQAIFNFSPAIPTSYTGQRIFGNSLFAEKSLVYEFDKVHSASGLQDQRGYGFTLLDGFAAEAPTYPNAYSKEFDVVTADDGSQVAVQTNVMYYKYMPSKRKITALGLSLTPETAMKDYNDWPVNYPVIRYEDVLLMYAEILLAQDGNIAGAMQIVNKIRARAMCDDATASTVADALKMVKRERRIELAAEGVRWFDLVRWGEWKSAIEAKFNRYNNPQGTDVDNLKDGRYLYPIPYNQTKVKPGLYIQNDGYNQ